jgi:uncharacterized membrane protein YwzB
MNVRIPKKIRIRFWLAAIRVWFSHHACDAGTLRVIFILMRVILTQYVLNYFLLQYLHKSKVQARLKNYHSQAYRIYTLRGIVTEPYSVSI